MEALVVGEVAVVRDRLAEAPQPGGITLRRLREDDEGRRRTGRGSTTWAGRSGARTPPTRAGPRRGPRCRPARHLDLARGGRRWCRPTSTRAPTSLRCGAAAPSRPTAARGIYKATLVSRPGATQAAERGYGSCRSTPPPDSRPILERLGLRTLTTRRHRGTGGRSLAS